MSVIIAAPDQAGEPYRELFICFIPNDKEVDPDDHDHHPGVNCDWGFACNDCGRRIDDEPCPDHAPTAVPGLRLVECQSTPRHWLFAHDRDDYGHGCPACYVGQLQERLLVHEWCRHWRWRRWRLTAWLVRWLPVTGYGYEWGKGHLACLYTTNIRWRWKR